MDVSSPLSCFSLVHWCWVHAARQEVGSYYPYGRHSYKVILGSRKQEPYWNCGGLSEEDKDLVRARPDERWSGLRLITPDDF